MFTLIGTILVSLVIMLVLIILHENSILNKYD